MAYFRNVALGALALAAMAVQAQAADDRRYATLHPNEPAIAEGQGRIYFYREGGIMGAAIQPTIYLNGETTGGRSKPGDYFYVDRPAGSYQVSTTTEKKESLGITLDAGQSVYVKTEMSMGFFAGHLQPVLKDAATAANEIKDCDWFAPKPSEAKPVEAKPADAAAAGPPPASDRN
jgi:hypothetical protein